MAKKIQVTGIIPAMITPFTRTGEVDFKGIRENVDFLIESGVSEVMCLGSTGEAATLSREECVKVIEATVEAADGRVPVMAGTGATSTREVVERTREAKSAGVSSVMIVTPFYEIPTQEGLYRHYATIAEAVDIPIVLYNIPPHTHVEIEPETLARLAEIDNVVALKDSSGNLSYFAEVMRLAGDKISVLTGGDDITLPCFALGCHGAILALANIAPRMVVDLYQAAQQQDMTRAQRLFHQLLPIARAISSPQNFPAPVKEAMMLLGRPAGPARSPIIPLSAPEKEAIRKALQIAGLI
ncbi:MAG TPA: 4-hydroxy-tetrahydrodipicolinate synthase [Dehalococcoidia bacterium]|jgi:4-hydroxy-tetrahydrodipicolinate synthase|nr:4-hydroxy-tetrahydrodipicolinate synthase [Dehalococcoidia bacterium]